MTLYWLLKDCENQPDLKIKIGSDKGNSFFYLGTVKDMLDNLENYNAVCQRHIVHMKVMAEDAVKDMLDNPYTPVYYARLEMKRDRPDLSYKAYEKGLELWFKSLSNKLAFLETKKAWARNYSALRNRKVIEAKIADPAVDRDVLRIVVEGHEFGKFWTTDDVRKLPAIGFKNSNGQGDGAGDDDEEDDS